MTEITLTKTRLFEGVWEGVLSVGDDTDEMPEIAVISGDTRLPGVRVDRIDGDGRWMLRIPIPVQSLSDGVQSFVITDAITSETLGKFTILAGEAMADDIRAEIDLLRAELDMLKRAFRRHCVETM